VSFLARARKGILEGGTLPIEEMGRAAQTIVQNMLEIAAKSLGLPITDKRVASKTRMTIMEMNQYMRS
jgi:hypothetical protein